LLTTSEFIIKRLIFSLQKFVQMTFRENWKKSSLSMRFLRRIIHIITLLLSTIDV
jgi:hypothetical protein